MPAPDLHSDQADFLQALTDPAPNGHADDPIAAEAPAPDPIATGADPFDLDALRRGQDFAAAVGVKRLITTVPVDRPRNFWWFQTHPDPDYRVEGMVLELKGQRGERYWVAPHLHAALEAEVGVTVRRQLLITSVNTAGTLFLLPLRLPGADGRFDDWGRSALEAAKLAETQWVRLTSPDGATSHRVETGLAAVPGPDWAKIVPITFREIIKIAFRDKVISSWDDPLLRRLRGEA
jgi:hypothetical protein